MNNLDVDMEAAMRELHRVLAESPMLVLIRNETQKRGGITLAHLLIRWSWVRAPPPALYS